VKASHDWSPRARRAQDHRQLPRAPKGSRAQKSRRENAEADKLRSLFSNPRKLQYVLREIEAD